LIHISASGATELAPTTAEWPTGGFVWCALSQGEWAQTPGQWTELIERRTGAPLLELHQRDLTNPQHPSSHDDTRDYDLVIFRQLGLDAPGEPGAGQPLNAAQPASGRSARSKGPPLLACLVTRPVGFVIYDHLLVSVHADPCTADEEMAQRLKDAAPTRLPSSPADLMLRMVHAMVDRFLDLRKPLTEQLDHWEAELLEPGTRFVNWRALLAARNNLHALEDLCDGQRMALQQWLLSLEQQPLPASHNQRTERELLRTRSRDVLEHIDRVVRHVQRLEQHAETAVQMHFSAQSQRTNDIMKTLTALTAIFLPLNLITGFFGMNFEFLPLIHQASGLWWAVGAMGAVAAVLGWVFWRKRYLAQTSR
jgi:Mg2+ and Co2+ transporter CorA